jgi:hypothetical protein
METRPDSMTGTYSLGRRPIFLLALLLSLVAPRVNSAEIVYFCAPARLVTSSPWSVDINVDGTPDVDVAVAGSNITILPAVGNSVLATNRSYYTNIPPLNEPVMVAFPDEVAPLTRGTVVPFFNPSSPFWRERRADNSQPLTLAMSFPTEGSSPTATNYFALKLRRGSDWIMAWARVRLTSGNEATCALDWGYDARQTPRVADEIVIGSRPSRATIRSVDKVVGIPPFDGVDVDLDADGTTDVSFGGVALTTDGGGVIIGGGTNGDIFPPSSSVLSYGLTMAGQNEVLRDNQSTWILPSGGGIADFVPPATFWAGGGAGLVSTSMGTNNIWIGHLAEVTNGYVGVRISKDSNFFYGWIHLQLSSPTLDGGFGPSILGWAVETRPQVPIVAEARGMDGDAILSPPRLVGNLSVISVSGLSPSNIILSSSQDLIHWTPHITNSLPFNFVYPLSTPENARYFRATLGN